MSARTASGVTGLSPPTRGSLLVALPHGDIDGSIPAHAGEPYPGCGPDPAGWVYPRPRGGAPVTNGTRRDHQGLSPPTRGSPREHTGMGGYGRSIPAHAGEPASRHWPASSPGVYPRPRGGAFPMRARYDIGRGLSPPTRGSRENPHHDDGVWRSIPAHAGEPRAGRFASILRAGLSPPTRGSHRQRGRGARLQRSIPAHAGEPLATACQHDLSATIWSRLHQDMSKNTSLRIGWRPPDKEDAVGIPDFLRRIPQVA